LRGKEKMAILTGIIGAFGALTLAAFAVVVVLAVVVSL
jgi:hypothetical protein